MELVLNTTAIPFVGAIIERIHNQKKELLIQTRWKPENDPIYSGTLEFPAGVLDTRFENVYDTLKKEILEETGLHLKSIINDSQTKEYKPKGNDNAFAFRPFCCVQQLKEGRPWMGFVFLCEVENEQPKPRDSELKDLKWILYEDMKNIFINTPEKIFTLELGAWDYYFKER